MLIDREGTVRWKHAGPFDNSRFEELISTVRRLLNQSWQKGGRVNTKKLSRIACITAVVLVVAAIPSAAQQGPQANPAEWSRADKEQFLLKAKVLRQKDAGRGITGSTRASLSNEMGVHDAHIQTIDEYKLKFESPMGTEFNFKDTWKFNMAAYILDRILDINMIPVTVERKVGGRAASVTWWIDDVLMTELDRTQKKITPSNPEAWNRQMFVVRVFDQLIANTDRNLGNIVILNNWDIWMIDHTRAFRTHTTLLEVKNLVKCDRYLLENLRKLDKQTLKTRLGKYLNGMEIDGVLARRDAIVKFFDDRIAVAGEAEVLYDYLVQRKAAYPWMQ